MLPVQLCQTNSLAATIFWLNSWKILCISFNSIFISGILSQWWKMSFGKFQRALGFHAGWNCDHPGRRVQSEERTGNLEGAWLPRRGPWTLSALGGLWRWHFVPSALRLYIQRDCIESRPAAGVICCFYCCWIVAEIFAATGAVVSMYKLMLISVMWIRTVII